MYRRFGRLAQQRSTALADGHGLQPMTLTSPRVSRPESCTGDWRRAVALPRRTCASLPPLDGRAGRLALGQDTSARVAADPRHHSAARAGPYDRWVFRHRRRAWHPTGGAAPRNQTGDGLAGGFELRIPHLGPRVGSIPWPGSCAGSITGPLDIGPSVDSTRVRVLRHHGYPPPEAIRRRRPAVDASRPALAVPFAWGAGRW